MNYRNQVGEFIVEDTGIGIHQDDLERMLYQPFERARAARGRVTRPARALALTITKLLAETMGGEISVRSGGKGSSFRVKLLLSRGVQPAHHLDQWRIASAATPARGRPSWWCGDDANQRDLVREMLEPLGFIIVTASSGAECLSLAERHKPNLILLDVAMPDMDGWQAGRASPEPERTIRRRSAVGLRAGPQRKADPDRSTTTT